MFSLFRIREQKSALREELAAVVQQARGVAQRTVEHTGALGALFSAEVKEYAAHQVQRLVMAVLACVLLLGAYVAFCAVLTVLFSTWLGWLWALSVVCLLNLVVAVLLMMIVKSMGGKRLAPATVEELKNDWQCLKLLCKENKEP